MIYFALIASVLLGSGFVALNNPKKEIIQLLVSFSGAYLLAMTLTHLLPEVFGVGVHEHHHHHENISVKMVGIFILGGILTQSILESFSKGAEHGHIHVHGNEVMPWSLFIALCLHAFSEGIPLGYTENESFLWAIVIHKIPIAIVLTAFFRKSNLSISKTLFFMSSFALMSPLGSFFASKIHWFHEYHVQITAVIIGIFLHISTVILFESTENHKFNYQKFIAIIIGMGVALLH